MNKEIPRDVSSLFLTLIAVFIAGVGLGAAILYFAYARPMALERNQRVTISGEGYHLLLTGNDLFIKNNPVFWHERTQQKVVALTFDDGPSSTYTPQVLAILKEKKVVATFFVVGKAAEQRPDLVKDEMAAGGEIENHSYSHPNLTLDTTRQLKSEISRTSQIIKKITGRRPIYIRPPKGLLDEGIIYLADDYGVKIALWSASLERSRPISIEDNVHRLVGDVKPGTIILAHDGQINRTKTVESLPFLIDELKAKGYRFVTLKELSKIR